MGGKRAGCLRRDIPDGVAVRTDRELLTLVWNNLFSNAVKFTDAGGSIHVFLRHTGTQAEVCVTDTGCGMSPETGRHIFENFIRATAPTQRRATDWGWRWCAVWWISWAERSR